MCPAARDFFARQGDLTRKYFVYFKSNQRHMAEKDPPFGHVGNFQTSPSRSIQIREPNLPVARRKIAGILGAFQDFSSQPAAIWAVKLGAEAIGTASYCIRPSEKLQGSLPENRPLPPLKLRPFCGIVEKHQKCRGDLTPPRRTGRRAMDTLEQLAVPLLEWFRDNARPLPWRDDPTP